jgi:quercetin dioxygenase-like cupin family protein
MVRNGSASVRQTNPANPKKDTIMIKLSLAAVAAFFLVAGTAGAHDTSGGSASKVTLVYEHELPNVPGKSIKGVLVEYGPGGFSDAHTHPDSAFIYATVLEGSILSQVNEGPVTEYKIGESFSEYPGDRHGVSKNGSDTKPAKLLAVFVVDTAQTELTYPIKK